MLILVGDKFAKSQSIINRCFEFHLHNLQGILTKPKFNNNGERVVWENSATGRTYSRQRGVYTTLINRIRNDPAILDKNLALI